MNVTNETFINVTSIFTTTISTTTATNNIDVNNPIGNIALPMWLHVAAMTLAYGPILWIGVGFARIGKSRHHVISQLTLLAFATLGLAVALGVRRPTLHTRMTLHGSLGILTYAATLAQSAIGSLVHLEYRRAERRALRALHALAGYALIGLVTLQCVLGLAVAFSLCESNMRSLECFGAFAASGAAALTAFGYAKLARVRYDKSAYAHSVYLIEAIWYGLLGIMSAVAVIQRDAALSPSKYIALIVLLILVVATLVRVGHAHRRRAAVPFAGIHGIALLFAAVPVIIIFALDYDSNEYDLTLSRLAAALIGLGAFAREFCAYKTVSLISVEIAVVLSSCQPGFATVYMNYDHEILPLGCLVALLLFVGTLVYMCIHQWMAVFGERPQEVRSAQIDELLCESDTEDVE